MGAIISSLFASLFFRFISMKFKAVTFIDSAFLNCYFEDVTTVGSVFKNCTFVDSFFYNTGEQNLQTSHSSPASSEPKYFLPPREILLCCCCLIHESHSGSLSLPDSSFWVQTCGLGKKKAFEHFMPVNYCLTSVPPEQIASLNYL